jgi:hypothetical protein
MKTKEPKMIMILEKDLLSLVAFKLKGRELFPKRVEEARRILKDATFNFS